MRRLRISPRLCAAFSTGGRFWRAARRNLLESPEEYRQWEWRHCQSRVDLAQAVICSDDASMRDRRMTAGGRTIFELSQSGAVREIGVADGQIGRHWHLRPGIPT